MVLEKEIIKTLRTTYRRGYGFPYGESEAERNARIARANLRISHEYSR